jgi:hypothetical protein
MYEHLARYSKAELLEKLKDPDWRLWNLYYIADKDGNEVLFQPWPKQWEFIQNIWYRNVVPKGRQRGFSTVVQIAMLDACLFLPNTNTAIIAQTEEIALEIFRTKIKFPYDRLPDFIRDPLKPKKETQSEFEFRNGSAIKVAMSAQGRTLHWLHVSEFGAICAKFPDKAQDIQFKSFPAVSPAGIIVVESTAQGREGLFYQMVQTAKAKQEAGQKLSRRDFKLHFASWWDAEEYQLDPELVVIPPKYNAYFERVEGMIGQRIEPERRAWYVATLMSDFSGQDEEMWQQYPSYLDEAFQVSNQGTFYAEELSRCRREGRILTIPHDPSRPVDTFWDLGDKTVVGFLQENDPWHDWIDFVEGEGEAYGYYVGKIREICDRRGFVLGTCYLPHDGDQNRPGTERLRTPRDMIEELGIRRIEIVPRIPNIDLGIGQVREAFPRYRFDQTYCAPLIAHIEGYRKTWNRAQAVWTSEPDKSNGHDHAADMLRQHSQIRHERRTSTSSGSGRRSNRGAMAV